MLQITARERLFSIGLVAVLAVWALYALALKPTRERIRTLQRILPEKQAQVQDLQAKSAEYRALQEGFEQLQTKFAAQNPDFQLLPFLEKMIERYKLAGHVVTMQRDIVQPRPDYSEVVVTIELREVSLRQLTDLLTAVESSDAIVQVGTLEIRKSRANDMLLDSTVGICSPQRTQQAPAAQVAQN